MIEQGDTVRLGQRGVSRFTVLEPDDEDGSRVMVEAIGDAPGKYPFSMRRDELVAITDE
ncbi:hypothetical protein GS896_27580 [Rhodococcus hoagii]|nr:hypothetical protein [Prescottella equi]MBM4654014.1 hypothetical protein [Prescottella equi]MBM4719723.1 hypothetical protein [Prescottella equi]NKR23520.1 hypothetical protein [Prescottella equi]NKT56326.1 hypothetical protein [Prescottella equi]